MKLGGRIGEYRLAKVFSDRITLEASEDTFDVHLYDPKMPKKRMDVKTEMKLATVTSTQPGLAPPSLGTTIPTPVPPSTEATKPAPTKEAVQERVAPPPPARPGRPTFPPSDIRRGRRTYYTPLPSVPTQEKGGASSP